MSSTNVSVYKRNLSNILNELKQNPKDKVLQERFLALEEIGKGNPECERMFYKGKIEYNLIYKKE